MTFKALLIIKAIVCLLFAPVLLFVPVMLLKILGASLESGGLFTAREYGAALVGGFMLTFFARNVIAPDARRAILLYLLVYDAIGVVVTLFSIVSGVLNLLAWSIVFVYLFFTAGSAYLLLQKQAIVETGA